MSLWFGKTSGWLPAAAGNDGEPDRVLAVTHSIHFFVTLFSPRFVVCVFFFFNAVSMLSKAARKMNYIGVPSLSYQIPLFQPTK